MPQYKGKPTRVTIDAPTLFSRFDNLEQFKERLDTLPEEFRQKMGTVTFPDSDSLSFTAPGVGQMAFRIIERQRPNRVRMLADTGLMPINIDIMFEAISEAETDVYAIIHADIPLMLRPMVGSKMQEAADKFGEMFGGLNAI